VPPFIRALEDAELGRCALYEADAFADGFEIAIDFDVPRGVLHSGSEAFEVLELLLDDGGRGAREKSIEVGLQLRPEIEKHCKEAESRCAVRTMRHFPAWRCKLVNLASPFAGRVAEHLALQAAAEVRSAEEAAAGCQCSCFAAVFQLRRRRLRVTLRSPPLGPDVSEIAAKYGGSGRPRRAFFSLPIEQWDELWAQPEPVLWDVVSGPDGLSLRQGDLVTIATREQRFRENPFDEWSYGFVGDSMKGGWIPTLAHTMLVATQGVPATEPGVNSLEEGDLLIARGQKGKYLWGAKSFPGGQGSPGWFPLLEGAMLPVHPGSVQALLRSHGKPEGSTAAPAPRSE